MPKLTKFRFKLPGGDWIDLGTHEVPDGVDPEDYFQDMIFDPDSPAGQSGLLEWSWVKSPAPVWPMELRF